MAEEGQPPFELSKLVQPSNWVTPNSFKYHVGELWYPLSAAIDQWDEAFHSLVLHDRVRMQALSDAMRATAITLVNRYNSDRDEIVRVLDIGTGCGILAYMLWSLVKDEIPIDRIRIFAIEANKETFKALTIPCLKANSSESGPQIAPGKPILACRTLSGDFWEYALLNENKFKSFDKKLLREFRRKRTKLFDAIICECIGGIGDDEGITEIMKAAVSLFAKEDSVLVPSELEIWAAPIWENPSASNSMYARLKAFLADPDHSDTIRSVSPAYEPKSLKLESTPFLDVVVPDSSLASAAQLIRTFRFSQLSTLVSTYDGVAEFPIKCVPDSVQLTGFKVYFRSQLFSSESADENPVSGTPGTGGAGSVMLDISGDVPSETSADCWKHTFLPFNRPMEIKPDCTIKFKLHRDMQTDRGSNPGKERGEPGVELEYSWSAQVGDVPKPEQKRSGRFCGRHQTLVGRLVDPAAPKFRWYDIYRTVGLISDVMVSLCVSVLFAVLLGLHDHTGLTWIQQWTIAGIALQLIRVVHSFAVLGSDHRFSQLECDEFTSRPWIIKLWRFVERALLTIVVMLFVILLLHPSLTQGFNLFAISESRGEDSQSARDYLIAIMPFLMFSVLLFWDLGAQRVVQNKLNDPDEKAPISLDAWWLTVTRATNFWVTLDLLGIGGVFVMIVGLLGASKLLGSASMGETFQRLAVFVPFVGAFLLGAFALYDYLNNASFYSTRIKEVGERFTPSSSSDRRERPRMY